MSKRNALNECPNALLGWPISETLQVYLCFLLPAVLSCAVYTVHFSGDLILAYQHFHSENLHYGLLTLAFLCLPALGGFIFTVTALELWPNKGCQNFIGWVCIKVFEHVFFPVWAMYGYAERIFWSIEAVRSDRSDRQSCLWNSMKTRPIELYFFLQAYLQAAPQLLLQINILLHQETAYKNDTVNMQLLSIIMSLIKLAATTMAYQNYESFKLLGRRYPWSRRKGTFIIHERGDENSLFEEVDSGESPEAQTILPSTSGISEPTTPQPSTSHQDAEYAALPESDQDLNSKQLNRSDSFIYHRDPDESIYEAIPSVIPDTTDAVIRDRSSTSENADVKVVSFVSSLSEPPNYPAPIRPDLPQSRFETFIDKYQLADKFRMNIFRTPDTIDLPVRKYPVSGREQDDVVGKGVLFIIWFCFVLSRILSISVFGRFFPVQVFYLLLVHFFIMTAVLLFYARTRNINRIILYVFLGYVYIFCIIEFRIKFKRLYRTYILYFIVVYTENFILTMVWCLEDWDSWWFYYLLYMILINSIMCVAFTILYIKFLKPSKRILYDVN